MQKHVNIVDLVKSFPTNILLQNLASIQQGTSLITFDHLAEKSEKGSISNVSFFKVFGAAASALPVFAHESVRAARRGAPLQCTGKKNQ